MQSKQLSKSTDASLKKLPVTVLSGFLGSGKTTLLKHVLRNKQGLKVCVIVNDMNELNIDAALIKRGNELLQVEEKMVEMQNGCICCTLREDLLIEVAKLAQTGKFDYLLIESTGISEPLQVAETFTFSTSEENDSVSPLSEFATLDTMVTVVDAHNFFRNLKSVEFLRDRGTAAGEEDTRTVVDLLAEQIEFANVILLNKTDLVAPEEIRKVEAVIKGLNPGARLLPSVNSEVPLEEILNTKLFDFEQAALAPGWLKEMRGQHVPETEEYGITSFVYRRRRPFHPGRLNKVVEGTDCLPNVVRSKGFFWLATRNTRMGEWSNAGDIFTFNGMDRWFCEQWDSGSGGEFPEPLKRLIREDDERAATTATAGACSLKEGKAARSAKVKEHTVSSAGSRNRSHKHQKVATEKEEEEEELDIDFLRAVQQDWDPSTGDKRQEIVVIGIHMDRDTVTRILDEALLTDEELAMGPAVWATWEDPFEPWEEDEDEEGDEGDEEEEEEVPEDDADESEEEEEEEVVRSFDTKKTPRQAPKRRGREAGGHGKKEANGKKEPPRKKHAH